MIDDFLADCGRYAPNKKITFWLAIKLLNRYQGVLALLAYRLGQATRASRKSILKWPLLPLYAIPYVLLTGYVRAAYDIRLMSTADIQAGLYIGHFGDILVERCKIGKHCNIGQSAHVESTTEGQPIVGDYVWIGPHAQIAGPYRISNGATISSGAVVKRDIPEQALCMGNPARVVVMNYDNSAMLFLPATTVKTLISPAAADHVNGTA